MYRFFFGGGDESIKSKLFHASIGASSMSVQGCFCVCVYICPVCLK